MTKGEACGLLLQHYIDDTVIAPIQRREILVAIPAEHRFVDSDNNGRLAILAIIQSVLDDIEYTRIENRLEERHGW